MGAERREQLLRQILPDTTSEEWVQFGLTTPTHKAMQEKLLSHIGQMWADNTWKGYASSWARALEFCHLFGLNPQQDVNVCLWIVSTGTEVQGQLQYCKNLMAVMNRLKWPTTTLSMFAAGLRHQGAATPIHQAVPILFEQVLHLLSVEEIAHYQLVLPIMLAWGSASRWDDLISLGRQRFILLTPTRVIIDWYDSTKTSKENPYTATMLTVIEGRFTEKIFEAVTAMSPTATVTEMSTSAFDRLMKKLKLPWTGHSFKKGAANAIVAAAARGLCSITLLPTVLKHQQKSDLVSVSIRYTENRVDMALALGTGAATKHL